MIDAALVCYLLELQETMEKNGYLTIDNVDKISMNHRFTYRFKAAVLLPPSNMVNSTLMSSSNSGVARIIGGIGERSPRQKSATIGQATFAVLPQRVTLRQEAENEPFFRCGVKIAVDKLISRSLPPPCSNTCLT